jgi:hypothetical protein
MSLPTENNKKKTCNSSETTKRLVSAFFNVVKNAWWVSISLFIRPKSHFKSAWWVSTSLFTDENDFL